MSENKQIIQTSDDNVAQVKFWGTLALAGIFLFVVVYFVFALFGQARTPISYIAIATFLVSILMSLISITFTLRRQPELGAKIIFYTLLTVGIMIAAVFEERVVRASLSILAITALTIWQLLPRPSWRWYSTIASAALILMWVIEWINPPWRIQLETTVVVGPAATVVFGFILVIVAGFQASRGNLRTRLLVAFLLVTLIPLGIVFFINNRITTRILTESSDAALQGIAAQTAASIDTFIAERLNDVRIESQKHILAEYLSLPEAERAGSESEKALLSDLFSVARRDQTFITSVGVIDKNGISLVDTEQIEVGVDKSQRNYFIGARDTQLPYVSPVEISPTTGVISLYFTAPVRDSEGNFIGVFRIRYNAAVLQTIINRSAIEANLKSVAIVVLDENHIRLADNLTPELILKSVVPLPADTIVQLQAERRLESDKPVEELSTNIPAMENGLNNLDQQPIFVAEFHSIAEGVEEEGTAVNLENQPWLVAVGQDRDIFLAPLAEQTRTNLSLGAIIAVLVALNGIFVAQTIASPVVRLTAVAQQITAGDFNVQAKVELHDEIGQLAISFNSMTAQLRDLIGSLERRVADRTRALETSTEVSRRLSTILNQDQLLKEVVEQVQQAFNYYHAHIYLFDENREKLLMAGGTGEAGRTMLANHHSIPVGKGLVGRAGQTNQTVLVPLTTSDPNWLPNALLPNTKAEIAVPIAIADNVIGVLDVQHNIENGLNEEDANLLQAIANQIAIALQNAQSYEITHRKAEQETILNTLSQQIQQTTRVEDVLQILATGLGQSLDVKRAIVQVQNTTTQQGKNWEN